MNSEEQQNIQAELNYSDGEIWIGATDSHAKGNGLWFINGVTTPLSYLNWGENQPNDKPEKNERCACIQPADRFKWHSYACDTEKYVVCESWTNDNLIVSIHFL